MKITFLGAAQTVTGSCFMVEHKGMRFAVDCGMHQGNAEIERRNENSKPYRPADIGFIVITHAHIDHSGLLPLMVKKGFKGPIYTTTPTADLLDIMLLDSAHIQEMEAAWRSKKRLRHGKKRSLPLYNTSDAEAVAPLIQRMDYNVPFEPAAGVRMEFHDAGHILGSAFVEMTFEENGEATRLVFSGDIGRPNQLLVRDPTIMHDADYLFMESTYGDRDHKDESVSRLELAEAIAYSYARKEKVIIPAFAVERTQELIFSLRLLAKEGKLPKDMPVYLDSPLAIRATEIFRKHPEVMDEEVNTLIANGEHPLDLPNLVFTQSTDESRAINERRGPAVVISASGMANAGRIQHHLRHNLWREGASVVFVGYQAQGTPGRKIVDGADKIRILGEEVAVRAKLFTIGGFSAHAGQSQLLDWLAHFQHQGMRVILVHGEARAQEILAAKLKERFGFDTHIPDYREELTLEPGRRMVPVFDPERARPRIDWDFLIRDAGKLTGELADRVGQIKDKPWVEQTEIRDRLLEVNRLVVELISEL